MQERGVHVVELRLSLFFWSYLCTWSNPSLWFSVYSLSCSLKAIYWPGHRIPQTRYCVIFHAAVCSGALPLRQVRVLRFWPTAVLLIATAPQKLPSRISDVLNFTAPRSLQKSVTLFTSWSVSSDCNQLWRGHPTSSRVSSHCPDTHLVLLVILVAPQTPNAFSDHPFHILNIDLLSRVSQWIPTRRNWSELWTLPS